MIYRPCGSLWGQFFGVPITVVDNHLKLCGSTALKVLLLMLRSPTEFCDVKTISESLSLDKSDVADALNYWVAADVLEEVENGPTIKAEKKEQHTTLASVTVAKVLPYQAEKTPEPTPTPTVTIPMAGSRMRYPRDEMLRLVRDDKTLSALVNEAQTILSKTLTSADMDSLTALYSYYGLSAHYIVTLLHYCSSINKRSMAYVESVAATWMNEGIDDTQVDSYIDILYKRRSGEGKIRAAFGIDRALTANEKKCVYHWIEVLEFGMDMIIYAYELTVDRTGKCAFSYLDKILSNWKRNGFTTVDEAKNEQRPNVKKQPVAAGIKQDDYQDMFFKKMMEEN